MRSRKLSVAATLLLVALISGCGRNEHDAAAKKFGLSPSGPSRCASGSLADADNPDCKRQGDANFNKFIGKGSGS